MATGVEDDSRGHMLGNSIQVRVLQHLLRPLVEKGWLPRLPLVTDLTAGAHVI